MGPRLRCKHSWIHLGELCTVPWVPEVFLACGGNFRCWPKADTTSVVGRSHERQPRLKSLWHPGYVSGDLQLVLQHCCETGLKAKLRFSPPTFKPVFTKHVVASCVTTDFWSFRNLQQPFGLSQDKLVWFVSGQTRNIAIQLARFAAVMLQNRSHVFVACFRCTFTWRLAYWLGLCSHHNG